MDESRKEHTVVLGLPLLGPLTLAAIWGVHLSDKAFEYYTSAIGMTGGDLNQVVLTPTSILGQGLVWGAKMGVSVPALGSVFGVIGWWLTAVAIFIIFRQQTNFWLAPLLTSILVSFTPIFLPTLGTEIPWILALVWLSIAAAGLRNWLWQLAALIFLVLTHFAISTVILALLLLSSQWLLSRRFPWRSGLLLLLMAVGLWWVQPQLTAQSFFLTERALSNTWAGSQPIAVLNEMNWLFLLPASLGLWMLLQQKRQSAALLSGFFWIGSLYVVDGDLALPASAIAGLLLSGLGIDWLVSRWQTDHARVLTAVLFLPLLLAQFVLVGQHFAERPLTRFQIERQVGDWLSENSDLEATVAGSARVAYWAGRPWIPLADDADLGSSLMTQKETSPDYVILNRHIAADHLTRTGWFQERYELLQQVASPLDSSSPYDIWGHRSAVYELGTANPLNVRASDLLEVVGYTYSPLRVTPGQPVQLTLFMHALNPVTDPLQLTVRLAAVDRQLNSETTGMITLPANSQQVTTESLAITTDVDFPVGAYAINFSLGMPDESVWPLYRNNDPNQLDRVGLGTVVVPWQGEIVGATSLNAIFDEQIQLTDFTIEGDLEPGGKVDVKLYWQSLRVPDKDFVVFVHALDTAGNLVAGHDGMPVNGNFPTTTWLIDDVIEDVHTLTFESLPESGDVLIQVGLYLPATGERLPVRDSLGVDQPSQSIPLTTLEIR